MAVAVSLASCGKKTHPAASAPVSGKASPLAPDKKEFPVTPPSAGNTVITPPAEKTFTNPMIVIDEGGNVVTSRDRLPDDIAGKVDYRKITRAFTPDQRKNLIYRFKMVPPRVIYIPEALSRTSAKGTYCVFRKKFWYWKKQDGLFYLDETYYQ